MENIYFALINKKAELAKGILYSLLILCYPWTAWLLEAVIGYGYGRANQIYVCRISFLFLLGALLAWACCQWISFLKKNWESLMLLGVSGLKSFLLFLSANTEILFLQIYGGTLLFRIQGMGFGFTLTIQAAYGFLICGMGMLLGLKAHGKGLTLLSVGGIGAIAIFLGSGRINYHVVYGWVMGEGVGKSLFSENPCVLALVFILALCLAGISVCLYSSADMPVINGYIQRAPRSIGPFRMNRFWPARYFWMYRSREFLLWKLCSTLFFSLLCCLGDSSFAACFTAYGICLITSFYFKDIYGLEQKKLLIYFMSDYSYGKFFSDIVKEGIWLLGDHIFLTLILFRLRNVTDVMILFLLAAAVFCISVFVNASLFAGYPKRQYQLGVCSALIKLHFPIVNLLFLYQWFRQGKKNWENLSYEYKP